MLYQLSYTPPTNAERAGGAGPPTRGAGAEAGSFSNEAPGEQATRVGASNFPFPLDGGRVGDGGVRSALTSGTQMASAPC